MTKKDYIAIAAVINRVHQAFDWDPAAQDAITSITDGLCRMLATDNPRFDRDRFMKACQP